jgi:hypothetical protein
VEHSTLYGTTHHTVPNMLNHTCSYFYPHKNFRHYKILQVRYNIPTFNPTFWSTTYLATDPLNAPHNTVVMLKLFLLFTFGLSLVLGATIPEKEPSGWPHVSFQAPFEATTGLLGAGVAPSLNRNPLRLEILLRQ